MKKPKQVKSHKTDWLSYMLDEDKKLAIPIGPRFQVDVPKWSGPPQRNYPHRTLTKSNSSKWLGTVIWSRNDTIPDTGMDVIGRGRPENCDCYPHGSILCVKRHINDKRAQLQKALGPAFQLWRFDEMGEVIANSWKLSEEQKFARIVKRNPIAEGDNFIKLALECFPSKSHKTVVSYYFNVYLPRRISIMIRAGCTSIDTDVEEDKKTPCSKGSRKRNQVNGVVHPSKQVKVGYLTGRR